MAPATYISPQIEHVLGYDAADWMRDPAAWHDHAHPDDAPRVLEAWSAAVAERRPFVDEYRMRAADGSWRWLRDEANPVTENSGGSLIYQGVMLDITERHDGGGPSPRGGGAVAHAPGASARRRLHDRVDARGRRQRSLGRAGHRSAVGVSPAEWLADLRLGADAASGRSRGGPHRVGGDRRARPAVRHGVPDDPPRRTDVWVHDQAVSVLRDGRFYAEGVFYDVTARRTAERALVQAEDRFRSLVERLPAIMYVEDAGQRSRTSTSARRSRRSTATPRGMDGGPRPVGADASIRMTARGCGADQRHDAGDRWSVDYRSITRDGG